MSKIIVITFLLLLSWNSYGQKQKFYYAYFEDRTPYVIVSDTVTVQKAEHLIVNGLINKDNSWNPPYLTINPDSFFILPKNQQISYNHARFKYLEIKIKKQYFPYFFNIKINDRVYLQKIAKDGNGIDITTKVESIHIGMNYEIVYKCAPVKEDSILLQINNSEYNSIMVASSKKRTNRLLPETILLDTTAIIKNRIESLIKDEKSRPYLHYRANQIMLSYQPFLFTKDKKQDTLFAVMASYYLASANTKGTFIVWDKLGNVLYRSEREGYYRIIGITDVDNDGNSEIILCNGSEYSCLTYQLMEAEIDKVSNNFRLKIHFKKVPPHFEEEGF